MTTINALPVTTTTSLAIDTHEQGVILPAVLPAEARNFLSKFYLYDQQEGDYRAEDIVEELVALITLGMQTPTEQQEVRYALASRVAQGIHTLSTYIHQYEMLLGFLLLYVEHSALYSVMGYSDLKQFALSCGATKGTVERAMNVYRLWPHFYRIGYREPAILIDGTLDTYKIGRLHRDSLKQQQQLQHLKEQSAKRLLHTEDNEEHAATNEWNTLELQQQLHRLTEQQRQQVEEEAIKQYCAAAYAEVERYRATTTEDLIVQEQKAQGKGNRPLFLLKGEWHNGTFSGTFTAHIGYSESVALSKNGYSLLLNGLSAKAFGEEMLVWIQPDDFYDTEQEAEQD